MANIAYSSGTGIIFSPAGNRIPITFSSESNKLLTLTDTSFNMNVPIVKGSFDTSSNQIGGYISNSSGMITASQTTAIVLNPTITIPSIGVWYIQGSLFITYSASSNSTDSLTTIWTQVSTNAQTTFGVVPAANYYPSCFLDQINPRTNSYSANSGGSMTYLTTQIFPISLVISLSSIPTNLYVSCRITKSTSNSCTLRMVANAFRIG